MGFSSGTASNAICDRCNCRYEYQLLKPDPNYHGLRCCPDCLDFKNPWLLPAIKPDSLTLHYPRPDTPLWPPTNPGVPNGIPFWDMDGIYWDDGVTRWTA